MFMGLWKTDLTCITTCLDYCAYPAPLKEKTKHIPRVQCLGNMLPLPHLERKLEAEAVPVRGYIVLSSVTIKEHSLILKTYIDAVGSDGSSERLSLTQRKRRKKWSTTWALMYGLVNPVIGVNTGNTVEEISLSLSA